MSTEEPDSTTTVAVAVASEEQHVEAEEEEEEDVPRLNKAFSEQTCSQLQQQSE